MSWANLIYINLSEPLSLRLDRRLETVNEFLVGACSICLFLMTDWVHNSDLQFKYGWIILAISQILLLVNMTIVIIVWFRSVKLLLKWSSIRIDKYRT